MRNVTINGKEYPFLFGLRSVLEFSEKVVNNPQGDSDYEHLFDWVYSGIKYGGGKVNKKELKEDLDMDIESALDILSYCRSQITIFYQKMSNPSGNGESKKKETQLEI